MEGKNLKLFRKYFLTKYPRGWKVIYYSTDNDVIHGITSRESLSIKKHFISIPYRDQI